MAKLEFNLAQGWTRQLSIAFETTEESAQLPLDQYTHSKQVHGNTVLPWSPRKDWSSTEGDGFFSDADTFIRSKGRILIKTADCAPLFYIDREQRKVCALHAGWRGLAQKIHRVPFEQLGFIPKTTWVWLGPCLNGKNFEVGPDMYNQFSKDLLRQQDVFETAEGEKKYFHTWNFLEQEFQQLGVELFYNVEIDTFEDTEYSSHRRSRKEGLERVPQLNYSWISAGVSS